MFRWSKKKKQHPETSETDGTTDQVTQRFTVNLPNGHKTVVRVSPSTPLSDLVKSVCKDKGLDHNLSNYALQIPKKPGTPVDLNATIQEMGVQELDIISLGRSDRNHTMSMPDLSQLPPSGNQPPSFTTPNGQHKKKRGFLSFLGKKDKKYKSEIFRSMDTSFQSNLDISAASTPTSTTPSTPTATTPTSIQRRGSDLSQKVGRPQSMFVTSNALTLGVKSPEQTATPLIAPPRKKRRAPLPPIPTVSQISENEQDQSVNNSIEIQKGKQKNTVEVQMQNESNHQDKCSPDAVPSQEVSGKEIANTIQSWASSDSSGYYESTPSTSESSKSNEQNSNKINTSTDTTPLDSTYSVNLDSSNVSPAKVSLNDDVNERSEVKVASKTPVSILDRLVANNSILTSDDTKIVPSQSISTSPSSTMVSNMTPVSSISAIEASTNMTGVPQTDEADSALSLQHQSVTATTFTPEPQVETLVPNHQKELRASDISNNQPDVTGNTELHEMSNNEFFGFDENKIEATNFDINDILDGVVFDEEPWPMQLTLAKRAGVGVSDKDQMMMMETASVTSENLDQIDNSSFTERPCAFIPPPPPSEPPPSESQSVDLESFMSTTAPLFMDKGTVVGDDNVSLSSAKSSPGRVSSGSAHELALFVEEISNMTLENTYERDNKLPPDSMNTPYTTNAHSNVKAEPVTWPEKVDFRDSDSRLWSLKKKGNQNLEDVDQLTQVSENSESYHHQIMNSFVSSKTDTPILIDKSIDNLQNNNVSDSDDEEYYTETIEELIIPIGPNGYDFSAARKKEGTEICIVHGTLGKNKKDIRNKSDSAAKLSSVVTTAYQSQPISSLPSLPLQLAQKEEFVLTNDDLSHVSFVQPKPEMTKADTYKAKLINTSSYINWSPPTTVSKPGYPRGNIKTFDSPRYKNVQLEVAQKSIITSSEPQHHSATTKEPTALPELPTVKPTLHTGNLPAFSDDETYSSDPILSKSRPHLVMNVHSHSSRSSGVDHMGGADYLRNNTNIQSSSSIGAGSDAVADNAEQPGSITSAYNDDTPEQQIALQQQYYALQDQFHQWQEQLTWNQSLLASQAVGPELQAVGPELQAEYLQQLMDQIAMQQQMMQQLQTTMLSLQQKQQNMNGSGQEHAELSAEYPARMNQLLAGAAEPGYIVAKGQSPTLSPPQKNITALKDGSSPSIRRSKFEKVLGPREQLMIAIRTFSKRELKSVPIEMTRWTSSAL